MKKILVMSFFLVLTLLQQAIAQDRTISGRVVDRQTGQGIPGVTVLVKGTTIGTATNIEGDYTLNVPADATTLQFSFIGYTTQEQPIGAGPVNVTLAVDAKQLNEVVVTALGIEREERALGYAATTVGNQEITQGRTSSPMNALQGKVAGVNISSASGAPGASTKVILRGYSSIGGDNNPLYVIDGVPINNDAGNINAGSILNRTQDFGNRANDINPDDIESITVLKGASATALYGSRAANGVILITTKKGKTGEKIAVDFTSSATFSRPLRLPQLQNTFGQGWNGTHYLDENGSWGPKMDGRDRLWGRVVDNSQQLKPFSAQEDNLKDFFETGTSYINTIGLSGGTDKSTFYLSYGNVREDGIIPLDKDSYNRNTLGLRGSTRGNKLSASSSLNYVRKDAQVVTTGQGGDGTTVFQEIIQVPRDFSIVDFEDINYKFNNLDNFYTQYAQNPYYPLKTNGNDFEENRVYGNFNLDYKFTDWLTATSRVGGDVANSVISDWIAVGIPTPGSPSDVYGVTPIPGRVNERTNFARELNGDFMLSTNNNFTEDLSFSSLIGYNVNERYRRGSYQYVVGLDIPEYYNLSNSSSPARASTSTSLRRLYGVYGQAEANFRDFLFVTVLARNDWSSTLPQDNNSFFYPGVNASFVFTDVAPGIQGVLNYGKVRAAWGKTGNDAPVYSINSVMVPGNVGLAFGNIAFPVNGINSFEVSNQIGNPNLAPEITSEYEFGLNLQFFNNRLGFDAAYYHKKTKGQILAVPTAATSGYTTQVMNIGEVENKGIELAVTATPVKTNDFNWDIRYTFSNNRNKVLSLTSGLEKITLAGLSGGVGFFAIEGQPLGVYQGTDFQRDPEGRIIVSPTTGFPLGSVEDVTYGNAQADFLMGLFNTVSYKNLSLSVGFDYRKGGLFYSYTQTLSQFVGNTTNTLYNDRQPFVVPNSVVAVPQADGTIRYDENTKIIDNTNYYAYWYSNTNPTMEREYVLPRDYIKLREVALNYSLPESVYGRTPFKGISVGIVGRNLWMWTPKGNNIVDPESTTFGNDLQSEFGEFAGLPTVRTLGGSLRVTL